MIKNFTKTGRISASAEFSEIRRNGIIQRGERLLFLFIICLTPFTANAQSVGGTISGATAVCPALPNSGFLSLTGDNGTVFIWEKSTDGGVTWTNTSSDTVNAHSLSYLNISQATCYRVVVQDGAFPPDTSTIACITIFPPSIGGTITGGGVFCNSSGTDTLFLTGSTGAILKWEFSIDGGGTWTNVANTTDTLIYPNLTQSTLYRAVVQNGNSCPTDTSSQASFVIYPVTVAGTLSISGNDTVCYGGSNDSLMVSGNVGIVISWLFSINNGSTWDTILPNNTTVFQSYNGITQTTWYKAVVKSGTCSNDTTAYVRITVLAPFPVNAGNDTTITSGQSVILNGSGSGTPLWLPATGLSSATIFTPTASPSVTTSYVLSVTDTNGCINSDVVLITLGNFNGMVSNLFTPNGDGINDTWYLQGIQSFPDNEVFVYNIYGNQVYNKKGYINDWKGTYNGSDLPDGTYYYILRFDNSPAVLIKGSLDILRSK